MLLAKNVDAIYSDDPKKNPNAVRYSHLTYDEVIERELKATDLTAITLCKEQNIPILAFAMADPDRYADRQREVRYKAGDTVNNL